VKIDKFPLHKVYRRRGNAIQLQLLFNRCGRGFALEVEEKAGLSGAVALGRVPKAKISDLVKAFGQRSTTLGYDSTVY